jgi:hypothetical protein
MPIPGLDAGGVKPELKVFKTEILLFLKLVGFFFLCFFRGFCLFVFCLVGLLVVFFFPILFV